jgi:hypothetical protein
MNYLLDANTLIDAKNRYYQMGFCPGFWDWVIHHSAAGTIASVKSIETELRKGNDKLADWAKTNSKIFLAESDVGTQTAFAEVATHVDALASKMNTGALEEFLRGADPWLIAKAKSIGATVVTQEHLDLKNRKKFLIPNVCKYFDVPYMDTFTLLNQLEAKFVRSF